ncbi:Neuferricin Cytochrome b5 domain-containing protein 2 Precursor [Larimichthys crocea]|uniref:Neuferricin n=1 Tax=Larimichthys crocea TaxID=215358 RepID=A0A6G0I9P6_LARCR|nr:Neuferricin Cytochrome b5 domain-containing protein 2 Precursor [Larimichthys crocea]
MLRCVLVACVSVAVLFIPREWFVKFGNESPGAGPPVLQLLSSRELSLYDGEEGSRGLYLAILGQVFDVNKGHKHYGPGGAYHFMAGKDASLAFITGDFTESGLTDDVSSLSPLQVMALYDWLAFYQKDYQFVGLLIGRFYSETGQPTEALLQAQASLAEGQRLKAQSAAEMLRFPTCNSQWSAAEGGRVWCSTKSGGVERNWVGVPRKLFSPGSSGVRCVCVEDPSAAEDDPNLQKYDGCPPHADSCTVEF